MSSMGLALMVIGGLLIYWALGGGGLLPSITAGTKPAAPTQYPNGTA